jgi:hypothetical protein
MRSNPPVRRRLTARPLPACALALMLVAASTAPAQEASASAPAAAAGNLFHDPFFQLSDAIQGCAAPRGPWATADDVRSDAHWRAQTGVSCYLAGKCRLMNSYLYDEGIAERVHLTFARDPRFAKTSVWAQVQRRIVTLQGCVANAEQVELLKSAMQGIDDVNAVLTELSVGASAAPPYASAASQTAP